MSESEEAEDLCNKTTRQVGSSKIKMATLIAHTGVKENNYENKVLL